MQQLLNRLGAHPVIANRPYIKQFVKFGMVGALNTVVDYALFASLTMVFHWFYLVANAVSFSIAVTNSYVLNRRWTFRSDNPNWRGEAVKFFIVNIIGLGMSEALLFVFVEHFSSHTLFAKALAIVVVLFWNFLGTRFWAFRKKPNQSRPVVQP